MVPVHARPRWGQHFLVAEGVARWISEWAEIEGRSVLEIGPGRGALTRPLLERASRVRAVEIDEELARRTARDFASYGERLEVLVGDVLAIETERLLEPGMHVVANLPYESATAIIRKFLESPTPAESLVLMVQREVCRRLAAGAGEREYGLLSVHTALRADVEVGRVVAPGCFRPPPRVESQVLRLRPLGRLRYEVGSELLFSQIVAAAFRMRRKMLRNSLVPFLRTRLGDGAKEVLESAGIDAKLRPEQVDVESFARLAAIVHRRSAKDA